MQAGSYGLGKPALREAKMNAVAFELLRSNFGVGFSIAGFVARLRERNGIIRAMHQLQEMPDCRLDDIGVARVNIPRLTGAEKLPYLRSACRVLADQPDTAALNKANFHTGK